MPRQNASDARDRYASDGFLFPVEILSPEEAASHRARMEDAEAKFGPLHYKPKVHTILQSPFELAAHARALDVAEALLGPDILIYNVTYIVKEAGTKSHVSWHQDLTYWGFDSDAQVSMWLALSPATAESGCMRMLPGSHDLGRQEHKVTNDETNVLFQGQTVEGVPDDEAVTCPLQPGQASFHHGWTLHTSMPNRSTDRRIGLNVQYIAPHLRQTKRAHDTALLARGEDRFGYYGSELPARADLDPAAVARQRELERLYKEIAGTG
jgi:hypothetical protein